MNRSIAYLRVSSTEQLDGHSMSNQEDQIKMYCKLYTLDLIDIVKDEGLSGRKTENRPGFNKIMDMVNSKQVDHIVTLSFTRFSRNTMDALTAINTMLKKDVVFHSITERIDTTGAIGKFLTTLLFGLSQFESDQIGDRVRSVKKYCKNNGRSYTAPLMGYDNKFEYDEKTGKKRNGKLIPNEELLTIKRIFELSQQGLSQNKIAWFLNSEKIPTKHNKTWFQGQVRYILNNPIYSDIRDGQRDN